MNIAEVVAKMNVYLLNAADVCRKWLEPRLKSLEPNDWWSMIVLPSLSELQQTSVYKGYKQDKIEMRGDRAEMSDFPLYLNMVAGGLDRRDQTIGGFSFVVKIYAVPVVEIIG